MAKELFRVRHKNNDQNSQVGAFHDLENAIFCCRSKGPDYVVFNEDFEIVYEPTEAVTPVTKTPIFGKPIIKKEQVIKFIKKQNPNFNEYIADVFWQQGIQVYGIRPDCAMMQSVIETGYFKYIGSSVDIAQNNFAGIGAVGGGAAGASFSTVTEGVDAQLQHLWAYATKELLPDDVEMIDPRFHLVNKGCAPNWEDLGGKWAVPGYPTTYSSFEEAYNNQATYGQKILSLVSKVSSDIPEDEEIPEQEEVAKPETPPSKDKKSKYYDDIPLNHWSIDIFDLAFENGLYTGTSSRISGFNEEFAKQVKLQLESKF